MIRVLIVDDEEDICDFLKIMLEDEGMEAQYVLLGEDALQLIKKSDWDVAIVDLKLTSSVTGLHVIQAIREKNPKTAVLPMSGFVNVGLRQDVRKLGITDFLEKPGDINAEVICKKIRLLTEEIK